MTTKTKLPSERIEEIYLENGKWEYHRHQGNVFKGNKQQAIIQYLDENYKLNKGINK